MEALIMLLGRWLFYALSLTVILAGFVFVAALACSIAAVWINAWKESGKEIAKTKAMDMERKQDRPN